MYLTELLLNCKNFNFELIVNVPAKLRSNDSSLNNYNFINIHKFQLSKTHYTFTYLKFKGRASGKSLL